MHEPITHSTHTYKYNALISMVFIFNFFFFQNKNGEMNPINKLRLKMYIHVSVTFSDISGVQIGSVLGLSASFFLNVFCFHVSFDCLRNFLFITLQTQVKTPFYVNFYGISHSFFFFIQLAIFFFHSS